MEVFRVQLERTPICWVFPLQTNASCALLDPIALVEGLHLMAHARKVTIVPKEAQLTQLCNALQVRTILQLESDSKQIVFRAPRGSIVCLDQHHPPTAQTRRIPISQTHRSQDQALNGPRVSHAQLAIDALMDKLTRLRVLEAPTVMPMNLNAISVLLATTVLMKLSRMKL